MNSLTKLNHFTQQNPPTFPLLNSHPSLPSTPISSISFSRPSFSLKLRSRNSPSSSSAPLLTCSSKTTPTTTPFSFLKTPLTIAVVTTAVFFSKWWGHRPLTALAQPPPTTQQQQQPQQDEDIGVGEGEGEGRIFSEEKEKELEEHVGAHPDDVEALKSLMEAKIKNKKLPEAIEVINKLITLEPQDEEWPLLRCHMYTYMGESEIAKVGFEEIIAKDPIRVEAYHGLVMSVSQGENDSKELEQVATRIEEAIERCRKEKRKDEVRDFKLLVAQIRVIQGSYTEALKVYQELVKEEPRDFRPYLCQGIIYTLLRKKDEAQKQFDTYKKLVPKGHPYARFFDDNMLATKVFSQMAENGRVKDDVLN